MIKIENYEVTGWEHAIRGMRNPMNSWEKSDSKTINSVLKGQDVAPGVEALVYEPCVPYTSIGPNDHELMMKLAKGGPVHAKYRRMITVYVDITAPLYWWKEFDTYKVGTVANSCSTMHKIHAKKFELDDFSYEHLLNEVVEDNVFAMPLSCMNLVISTLNSCRQIYLDTKNKTYWWQLIQLLPSSYNQKRTVMLNYEVLVNIYESRKEHKLDEWRKFCQWIEGLPYSEIITGEVEENVSTLL